MNDSSFKKDNAYNICFSLDDEYCHNLAVAILSILSNSSPDESFNFFILDGGISAESKLKIETLKLVKNFNIQYVEVNKNDFSNCPLIKDRNENYKDYHVTIPTYFRFELASLFLDLDKILYLDPDILVLKSLKDIMSIELNDNYAAMVLDAETDKESSRLGLSGYYNAGIMLVNLKKWREDNIQQKLFETTERIKNTILWQDQDVMNILFEHHILELDSCWNFQFFLYDSSQRDQMLENLYKYNIIHFAGLHKPLMRDFDHPLFYEYYDYLAKTPWRYLLLQMKQNQANEMKNEIKKIYDYVEKLIFDSNYHLKSSVDAELHHMWGDLDKVYKYIEEKNQEFTVNLNALKDGVQEQTKQLD